MAAHTVRQMCGGESGLVVLRLSQLEGRVLSTLTRDEISVQHLPNTRECIFIMPLLGEDSFPAQDCHLGRWRRDHILTSHWRRHCLQAHLGFLYRVYV
jgi:hypothetical protein